MIDTDEQIRAELDRAYPAAAAAPDWSEVLRRVPPRRHRRGVAAGAFALAAAAAVLVALGAPWRSGPSFTDRALAAIGSERYVVAVVEPEHTYDALVDLATGKKRPVTTRTEYVVDSGSSDTIPTIASWRSVDGVTVGSSGQGSIGDDPGLATLVGGYRKALADGSAKVVAETTYRGRRAKIVRFTFDYATVVNGKGLASPVHHPGGATEDVAVDASTYRPLWVDRTDTEITGGRTVRYGDPRDLIVSIESTDRAPAHPSAEQAGIVLTRQAVGRVTRATAPLALGPRAVWPGPAVGGLRFGSVRLEQLWPLTPGRTGGAPAPGLDLVYTGGGRTLEVQESAKLQPGGFTAPKLLPPAGTLRLTCYGCGVANWPAARIRWTGQLRDGPLFVGITAPTPALVLAAARALTPMP